VRRDGCRQRASGAVNGFAASHARATQRHGAVAPAQDVDRLVRAEVPALDEYRESSCAATRLPRRSLQDAFDRTSDKKRQLARVGVSGSRAAAARRARCRTGYRRTRRHRATDT
jgi:hypothetical protein